MLTRCTHSTTHLALVVVGNDLHRHGGWNRQRARRIRCRVVDAQHDGDIDRFALTVVVAGPGRVHVGGECHCSHCRRCANLDECIDLNEVRCAANPWRHSHVVSGLFVRWFVF